MQGNIKPNKCFNGNRDILSQPMIDDKNKDSFRNSLDHQGPDKVAQMNVSGYP